MTEKNLPEIYKGYSTQELLEIWDQVAGEGIPSGTPVEKIDAMRDLLREFKLGVHAAWGENQIRFPHIAVSKPRQMAFKREVNDLKDLDQS